MTNKKLGFFKKHDWEILLAILGLVTFAFVFFVAIFFLISNLVKG